MKFKLLLIVIFVAFLLIASATAIYAQGEPPPPYAGLENPFSWSDASVQEAGKGLYRQSCLGCHGVKGDNLVESNFSAADYPASLEERPDFYFWLLSEGRLDEGMPAYKSSLSEEQRWQVLTYLWSLGAAVPSEVTPPPIKPPAEGENPTLQLAVPKQAQSGQPLTLNATLSDSEGKPIGNALVKFFVKVDFFTTSLMEIGEAVTNGQGVAILEYVPRQTGDIQLVAFYEGNGLSPVETATTLTLAETDEPSYQAEAGIQLPAPGEDVLIGPESALELGNGRFAPTSAFRLPGGIVSWLLLLIITVMLIWFTYFRVLYQVFRIPIVSQIRDTDTRLVPLAGLVIVVAMGILLVLMLITGPYSHFHLLR